jgi:RNase adaptor protein for sRNA GlmZ degradation
MTDDPGAKLVLVHGDTSTGKTTLAKKLSEDLALPSFIKDEYKERRFQEMGYSPSLRRWIQLERESWREMNKAILSAVMTGQRLLLEGNVLWFQRSRMMRQITEDSTVVQIYCVAAAQTVFRRYVARRRHPLHLDRYWRLVVLLSMVSSKVGLTWYRPIRSATHSLSIDTTDFSTVEYDAILKWVRRSLDGGG